MAPPKKIILLAPHPPAAYRNQTDELDTEHSSAGEDESDTSHSSTSEDIDEADGSDGGAQTKLLTPPPTLVKKRKRSAKDVSEPTPMKPTYRKVVYNLSMFSAAEMEKPATKRSSKNASLRLDTSEPWDTMKAQILVQIEQALSPLLLDFSKYEIMFYIQRVLPKPGLVLMTDTDYNYMIERAHKIKTTDLIINLVIVEKKTLENKENIPGDKEAKMKLKKKTTKDPATLPGNVNKNSNIILLQEHWKCQKRQETCVGVYCYPDAETGVHMPLNHARLDCWASAMLKGEECATLNKPPNHKLFDDARAPLSPVLQRRLDAQKANANKNTPVFNLTLGNDLLGLFHPQAAPVPVEHNPKPSTHTQQCLTLMDPSRNPGQDMPIDQFCKQYDLSASILKKLQDNSYMHARILRFITIEELKMMEFRLGEIATLRDAVETWSVLKTL